MVRVAPIKMFYNSRTLWFDPCDLDIHKGDNVVVSTARGTEFGEVIEDVFEVEDAEIQKLKSPLKQVKRLATEEDVEAVYEMERKSNEALPVFKEMAAEANSDMHPVSVEYLLDGDKAVFYFEAEERVDFRDLVRKLAAHFHVRIDMRQIGVRDEARMVGGLGHCGQELCCKRMGGEFCPVSIRMAKEQDLSLNPQKISGLCGRLMCCLRYEFDAYKDFKSRAPKYNGTVQTPDGAAKVVNLDVPREIISLKLDGEKPVKVPLSDLKIEGDSVRPNSIDQEAWERANAQTVLSLVGGSTLFTSQFTGKDKLASAGSVRHAGSGQSADGSKGDRGRRTTRGTGGQSAGDTAKGSKSDATRKPRRRHSTKMASGEDVQTQDNAKRSQQGKKQNDAPKKRTNGNKRQQKNNRAQAQDATRTKGKGGFVTGEQIGGAAVKQRPHPGQKSSGLRQQQGSQDSGNASDTHNNASAGSRRTQKSGMPSEQREVDAGEHRRVRRRSHKTGGASSTHETKSTGGLDSQDSLGKSNGGAQ